MQKKLVLTGIAALFALVSGAASAQAYFGASLGQSNTTIKKSEYWHLYDEGRLKKNETDTAFKIFGGYKFNANFAVEAGYADLGSPDLKLTVTDAKGKPTGDSGKGRMDQSAFFIAAKGILPISEKFSLFGKLGASMNRAKYSESYSTLVNSSPKEYEVERYSDSKRKISTLWGIGAEYAFTKQLGLRLEYENFGRFGNKFKEYEYHDNGIKGTGRTKVDALSLGVTYGF